MRELSRPRGERLTPMRAIRKKCLECMGGSSSEVKRCDADECWLWPYRLGRRNQARRLVEEEAC